MKANPPWANRLIADNWQAISAEVRDQSWLPAEAPGSRGGKHREFVELGCGHYGCVFATAHQGIVFKISTDSTEVDFVKTAMKIGQWPAGIVRYHAVLDLAGSHRKRPVFVVWREEAFDVGRLGPGVDRHAQREFERYHQAYRSAATYVRTASTKPTFAGRLTEAKQASEWAWDEVVWEDGLLNELNREPRFMRWSGNRQRLAAALRICEICFELMEHTNYASEVGAALGFYLEHGILLADVHMNNIGRVTRDDPGYGPQVYTVITDPGHAVRVGDAGVQRREVR